MKITNLFHPFFFFFLFIFLLNPSIAWTTFSPIDNFLLDCGSSTDSVILNRKFIGDSSKPASKFLSSSSRSTISLKDETPSPHLSPLYDTVRVFTKPFNYLFQINKNGHHLVRLHFSPFNSSQFNLSNSLFHVSANGFLLLTDFNGFSPTKNINKNPILKEFLVSVQNGKLDISFTPSQDSNFGFVNAIEVFSAPDDLVADTAKLVTSQGNQTIYGLTHQALETVYRLNVGGPKVTPFNDTLWRTWIPDNGFVKWSKMSKAIHFGGRIKYQNGRGLSREVGPDNVYSSARVMSMANASPTNSNITWVLPVEIGYMHLVRLHFCDIASMTLNELYFNIFINGNLAVENLDLSQITGMLASPYYADFVVDDNNLGVITVTVSPSSLSNPARIKAILNGLEVLKMNNSMGSLDGRISVVSIMKSRPRESSGVLVPTIAVTSLLVVAFVMIYKKKAQDSLAWTQLPVDASEGKLIYNNQPRKFLFF